MTTASAAVVLKRMVMAISLGIRSSKLPGLRR
jgi:hypothetical protein